MTSFIFTELTCENDGSAGHSINFLENYAFLMASASIEAFTWFAAYNGVYY